ncbi:MAG: membrane protein insertion efficiency factor YidD [candidate division WOR-3 bacterium]
MIFLLFFVLCFDMPERSVLNKDSVKYSSAIFNDLKIISLFGIRIYQMTISIVQGDVCNFHPSCSRYGAESIKRFGFLKGMLKASDRIQRCHGMAWFYAGKYYEVVEDSIRGPKLLDQVKP